MSLPSLGRIRSIGLALPALVGGLALWLWPLGIGGKMPVGGDVTQFSIGLMAVLHRALRAGRLPLWNDLWGYGFPGLAESQMGVFYPPHLVLYGLFPVEVAYTVSLVLHTLWGALGTYWAARRFQVAPAGAALAAFAWSTSGFFVIHLPHQWGYTVGSWMPWAWGLAWGTLRREGTARTPLLLALVLTLQILPGHFQLAFETQVGIGLMVIAGTWRNPAGPRGVLAVALAGLAVLPLAALQLWPTYRLALLASARRDYEYLSGFAASPLHLVSYVAPGLFHVSPLWRPLVWDSFHTSPEEYLAYIGLVPLFLAVRVILSDARKDAAVRVLAFLAVGTLILSLGPYFPGFGFLCRVPGFSFFRAPARWSLATALALALLAGRGWNALPGWPRPGRALGRFAVVAALAPLLVLATLELALASTERPGWPLVANAFDRTFQLMPWSAVEGASYRPFRDVIQDARRPQEDSRIPRALARQGARVNGTDDLIFTRKRLSIYAGELGGTMLVVLGILLVAPFASRPRMFTTLLLAVTAVDLLNVGRLRVVDVAPLRPLTAQSTVLAQLAKLPLGTRTADTARNLPLVAGADAISSYRTLDLPALTSVTTLAGASPSPATPPEAVAAALSATGTDIRILDPFEGPVRLPGWSTDQPLVDRPLAGWLHGAPWIAQQGPRASTFTLLRRSEPANVAWLVPLTAEAQATILGPWSGNPADVLAAFAPAKPLTARRSRPEQIEVEVRSGPSDLVVLSQLAAPQWEGRWVDTRGESRAAKIEPAFSRSRETGWQAIRTPGPGTWKLILEYRGRDEFTGVAISACAWAVWLGFYLRLRDRIRTV